MKKKLFSIIMCVLMVMCFMPTATFADITDSSPSEQTVVAKIGDTGYTDLATALKAALATDTVTLETDITLTGEWTPVSGFKGTFDGQNHTITGLKITTPGADGTGLFASLDSKLNSNSITIKNLIIEGAVINLGDPDNTYVGVLVGVSGGSTIENVIVKNATISTVSKYVGGLCGAFSEMGGVGGSIKNCTVSNSTITGKDQVGGLAGFLWSGVTESCDLTSNTITATEERAGGIFGKLEVTNTSSSNSRIVKDCKVSGGSATAPDYAGGLSAQFMGNCNLYSITGNTVENFVLTAGKQMSAFATIRSGQDPDFLNALSTNVTGNTLETLALDESWQKETNNYGFDVYTKCVAKVGDAYYASIADAVSAASGSAINIISDVKLANDVTANIVIPANKSVTLDLNGYTLTNDESSVTEGYGQESTIVNFGTLTVVDSSSAKTGKVDNVTHAAAALYNGVNATATLSGGTFDRTAEAGTSKTENGGNSWYTICNHGEMIVNAGVTVTTANANTEYGKFSSLFENGYQSSAIKTDAEAMSTADTKNLPSLTINGGSFNGGLSTIKNDDYATLNIVGGEFTNFVQACVQNHNDATISGGTYTPSGNGYAVINCGATCSSVCEGDSHAMTITGGTFNGGIYKNVGTVVISGGTFSTNPSAYLAYGYAVVGNADGTWGVKKVEAGKVEVETKDDGTKTVTETTTEGTTKTETKLDGTTTTTVTTNPVKDKVAGTTTATTTEVVVTKDADGAEVKTTTETKEVTKKTDTVATTEKTVTKKASDGSETVAVTKIVEDKGNNVAVTTTVEDNTAKVEAKIAENKTVTTKSVTVDATAATANTEKVEAAEVTLPAATVKALNEIVNSDTATRKVESVELKTDVATLEIDQTALKTLTANADESKALVLSVEEKEPTTEEATEKDGKKVTTKFELTATVDGKNVFDSTGTNNGTITVKVPYTPAKNSSVKVFYVPESGEQVDMNATYKDGYVSWETNHFSLYDFVEEKGEITISVTNAEDATSKVSTTPGKEVKFNVKLDNNTKGITGLQLDLVYNDKVLTLQKVDYTGCIFESYLDPDGSTDAEKPNYNVLSFGDTEGNVGNTGMLATLTFKVAEDAQTGSYDIKLVCDDGEDGNVTTVSGSGATATINNAEVVISSYGDVDGDGDVDLSDIMQLRRHVAKWGGYAKLKNLEAGDLNGDGKYTLRDVQILTYYNAGDYEGYKTLPYKKASQTA